MYSEIGNPTDYHVGLYIRLSKEDENEGPSESVSNQKSLLDEFVKAHRLSVYGTYIDDGWSGTSFDRPDFRRLIDDIEAKKVNMVITEDLSRLGRDYILTGHYMVQGRSKKISYKSKKCVRQPREDWVIVEGTHEPLIDPEVFSKVRRLVNGRRTTPYDFLLKGLICCHECGCPLAVPNRKNAGGGDCLYFVCRTYQRFTKAGVCTCHSIKGGSRDGRGAGKSAGGL